MIPVLSLMAWETSHCSLFMLLGEENYSRECECTGRGKRYLKWVQNFKAEGEEYVKFVPAFGFKCWQGLCKQCGHWTSSETHVHAKCSQLVPTNQLRIGCSYFFVAMLRTGATFLSIRKRKRSAQAKEIELDGPVLLGKPPFLKPSTSSGYFFLFFPWISFSRRKANMVLFKPFGVNCTVMLATKGFVVKLLRECE